MQEIAENRTALTLSSQDFAKTLLSNNSGLRFPEGGEPYHGEWVPPARLSDEDRKLLGVAVTNLDRSLQLGGDEGEIVKGIGRLAAHFPNNNTEDQWRVIRNDYAAELKEFPTDIVQEAIRQWKLKGRFFPKLSELMKLIEPQLAERKTQVMRGRLLLSEEPPRQRTEHVRDPRIEEGLSDLVAKLKAKSA